MTRIDNIGWALLLSLVLGTTTASGQGEPGPRNSMMGIFGLSSFPTGSFSDIAETGYGGGIRYHFGLSRETAFTVSAAYIRWGEKVVAQGTSIEMKSVQILLGTKYYVVHGLFLSAELGLNVLTATVPSGTIGLPEAVVSRGRFALPLGLGFQFAGVELAAKYFLVDVNYSNVAVSLGYNLIL